MTNSILLSLYTSLIGSIYSLGSKADDNVQLSEEEFFTVAKSPRNTCSTRITFQKEQNYNIFEDLIINHYGSQNFEERGQNGKVMTGELKMKKLVLTLYRSTRRLHIQGAATSKWYKDMFPLFVERFQKISLAQNINSRVEDVELEAATSEKAIIPPTESSSYTSLPTARVEDVELEAATSEKAIIPPTESSSDASLPTTSPIHSPTPVKNVSSEVNDHGILPRVAELETKIRSLQEQMDLIVQQMKDLQQTVRSFVTSTSTRASTNQTSSL
ncbi:hypothetical protein SNE40_006186 [Patella caerulea]|uniref:Uncharacterized protein n=1 Tax=Patella caerulea TaxID=87958 RepID=A0AAN8QAW2_PATCE